MPQFQFPFNPQKGAHLQVCVGKPLSMYDQHDVDASKQTLDMLIDTGASKTAISPAIAQAIGLQPKGKVPLRSATGEVKANLYVADLMIENIFPQFYIPDIEIIEFQFGLNWRNGFIGRDFLSRVTFEMNGPLRQFTITI